MQPYVQLTLPFLLSQVRDLVASPSPGDSVCICVYFCLCIMYLFLSVFGYLEVSDFSEIVHWLGIAVSRMEAEALHCEQCPCDF